jgi:hypothetical protein
VQGATRRNAVMAFAHDQMEKRDDEINGRLGRRSMEI